MSRAPRDGRWMSRASALERLEAYMAGFPEYMEAMRVMNGRGSRAGDFLLVDGPSTALMVLQNSRRGDPEEWKWGVGFRGASWSDLYFGLPKSWDASPEEWRLSHV